MIPQPTTKEELDDLKKRQLLQGKLQEAIRRSATPSELKRIEQQIEELNQRLAAYAGNVRIPAAK
jgi:hypothetical protein